LWEFKDESVLTNPRGVTVDNDGNAYVTSTSFNSVVVIEPDGGEGRQILSSNDGLKNPWGIYFDKSKSYTTWISQHRFVFKFPQLVPFYCVACDGVSVTVCLIYLLSTCCYSVFCIRSVKFPFSAVDQIRLIY
jgi:hypothetical protein